MNMTDPSTNQDANNLTQNVSQPVLATMNDDQNVSQPVSTTTPSNQNVSQNLPTVLPSDQNVSQDSPVSDNQSVPSFFPIEPTNTPIQNDSTIPSVDASSNAINQEATALPESSNIADDTTNVASTEVPPINEQEQADKPDPLNMLSDKIAKLKAEFVETTEDSTQQNTNSQEIPTPPLSENGSVASMGAGLAQEDMKIETELPPTPISTDTNDLPQTDVTVNNLETNTEAVGTTQQSSLPVNDEGSSTQTLEEKTINPLGESILPEAQPGRGSAKQGKHYRYNIDQLLDLVIERKASDIHINVGYPVMVRVDGTLIPVCEDIVTEDNVGELILPVLDDDKRDRLEVNREVDLGYSHQGKARFRINAYFQKQTMAAAMRLIPSKIKTIDELGLPPIYHQLCKLGQGLILVTGPTGHGKTTTLAAIIQEINMTRPVHILTIEDPVEYIFEPAKALVSQREIQDDTHSWEIALKSAMREDPNVVLVGEMRDFETISATITLAETGHLVFATLHTNSASQSIDRMIDVFPENQQSQVRAQLANVLEAVIAQRLVPLDGGGRRAASEILLANPAVRNLIREAKTHQVDNVIRTSADIGMVSLEQALVKMVRDGVITMEKAMSYAVRPEEVVRLLKGG